MKNLIGNRIFRFKELASTNDKCAELAGSGEPEGCVVVADVQTKGRGRLNRKWFSPQDEGLYLSILLKPEKKISENSFVPLLSALAVAKTIEKSFSLKCTIKMPNDVLIDKKKVCGVLVEGKKGYLIVGIGINVNNKAGSFPDDIKDKATSLFIESGKEIDKERFLERLLNEYDGLYSKYRSDETAFISELKALIERAKDDKIKT